MKPRVVYALAGLLALAGFAMGYVREKQTDGVESSQSPISDTGQNPQKNGATVVGKSESSDKGGRLTKLGGRPPAKPATSLKEVLAYPSMLHRSGALKAWFDKLPTAQFDEILSTLLEDQTDENQQAIQMLFLSWAERAPEEGVKFLKKLPAGWERNNAEFAYFKAWGNKNRTEALEWCRKNLTGIALYRALKANEAAPKTMEAIQAVKDRSTRMSAIREYTAKKANENRMLALDEMLKMPNSQDRVMAAQMVINEWGKADPYSAMLWLKGLKADAFTPEMKSRFEGMILENLISKDIAAAKRFVGEMPAGGNRVGQMDKIASRLISDDLPSALTYFEEIKAQDPNSMPENFFKEWLRVDPENASKRLKEEITKIYPADKQANESWRISNMMKGWVDKDPAAAAKFAATLPEVMQPAILQKISRSWIRQDGEKAAQWMEALPDGKTKNEAMKQLGAAWSEHDATRSNAWLKSLPQDSARWSATQGIASSTIDNDPDTALTLVRTISNEDERMKVLGNVWQVWFQTNKPSAEDWLKNAGLSEAERAAIKP